MTRWTSEEDRLILQIRDLKRLAELLPHRTLYAVRHRRKYLRLREIAKANEKDSGAGAASAPAEKSTGKGGATSDPIAKGLPEGAPELPSPDFGYLPLSVINAGAWLKFGLVSDTHLACKEERLAELHCIYDLFAEEGITTVFHAGNIVDGYHPRINADSVYTSTVDGQVWYVIDNYPAREGITTYFITGDDHEGWWIRRGFNFGAYLTFLANQHGRTDLQYIGHVEADVEIRYPEGGFSILKIQHPGGGSAYARSYTGQKQVEAFEGGEKPHVLVQGHYHVSNYMQDRNVHVISLPGFQDQTVFARKKRLRMEVGGAILAFRAEGATGIITRCAVEFVRFFTRSFYRPYLRSDARILRGHLILGPGGEVKK